MQLKHESFDVVVVGGLTTALLLRQLGLSVCVLDKSQHPLLLGRADALNARTQETLEVAGVLTELEELGLNCNTSSTFADGVFLSRQSHWWTSLKNIHRPNFLMIGQADIEKALLSKLDITVHRNSKVNKIEEVINENGRSSTTRVHYSGGACEAKFVVGADGARSVVRQQLSIPFEGTKPEMIWAVLDTFIDTDFPVCPEIITFQIDGQARVSWIPRERGMARFYVLLDGEITQALTEAKVREVMKPYNVVFRDTEWFSTFEIKERVVQTMFSPTKSVVLAGDAAHIHAVNGGQGLNTGVADAFALAWRLDLAVRGFPAALSSYETERLGSAKKVIDVASKLVRSTIKTAKEYVDLIEANAGYITGTGVHYPIGSSIAVQGSKSGIFVPGSRCPDVYLHTNDKIRSQVQRLYQSIGYGKFLFICSPESYGYCRSLEPHMELRRSKLIVSSGIDSDLQIDRTSESSGNIFQFTEMRAGRDVEAVHIGDREVVVVRPDFVVGYVGPNPNEYFEAFFASNLEENRA